LVFIDGKKLCGLGKAKFVFEKLFLNQNTYEEKRNSFFGEGALLP